MTAESLQDTVRRELPQWLRQDPDFRAWVLEITHGAYPSRAESHDWFHEILGELRRDREEQHRKWEANQAELQALREEQNRKWEANQAEMREEFRQVYEALKAQAAQHERSIGALGARWGIRSEQAFRNALAGILEQSFGVQVLTITEYDPTGVVFGRPDQIELDVIIKNGLLIICELKSSIDKAGMYIFERKARFYERLHQRQADRLIVISPMIDDRARPVAEALGIECFSDSLNVETL